MRDAFLQSTKSAKMYKIKFLLLVAINLLSIYHCLNDN